MENISFLRDEDMLYVNGGNLFYQLGYYAGKMFRGIYEQYNISYDWTRVPPV
jgi:hypothetical protein